MRRTDTLIVGGGPAGSVAAAVLAKGGAKPLILERHDATHDALCGGFLSWRTLHSLRSIGFDPDALRGHPISKVAVFSREKQIVAKTPDRGIGVSRFALDTLLMKHAEDTGACVERGQSVRMANLPPEVRLATGGKIAAKALFLATGKHDLRGLKRPSDRIEEDGWMGLRFRIKASRNLQDTLNNTIELHLFHGGYAGFLLQEDGSANLCMAMRKSRLSEAGGKPAELLDMLCAEAPSLARRLDGEPEPDHSDAIGTVPYGWRATNSEEGLFRLGDQAAVIPSLAGEGVGIAIASGIAAGRAYLKGGPEAAPAYQRNFGKKARRPLAVAGVLKRLSENPARANTALDLARIPGLMGLASRMTRIA